MQSAPDILAQLILQADPRRVEADYTQRVRNAIARIPDGNGDSPQSGIAFACGLRISALTNFEKLLSEQRWLGDRVSGEPFERLFQKAFNCFVRLNGE